MCRLRKPNLGWGEQSRRVDVRNPTKWAEAKTHFRAHIISTEMIKFVSLMVCLMGEDQSSPCAPPALRGDKKEKIRKDNYMKDKFINFRATEKEKKQLEVLAKKAKLSQADFIRHSIFNKEIVVIDGLKELQKSSSV